MPELQHTISKPISFSGKGLHTGKLNHVTLKPGEVNTGILLRRVDLEEEVIFRADCDLIVDVSRGTTIEYRGHEISTIEHLMSAIVAMGVDNLLIEIDGMEVPILDGSAQPFIELIKSAGIQTQNEPRTYFVLNEPIRYYNAEKDVEITAIPHDEFAVTVMIDFDSEVVGQQFAQLKSLSDFEKEIAPARTFCFLHEVESLLEQDLIKGGELSCAIVIVEKELEQSKVEHLSSVFNEKIDWLGKKGVLNSGQLRFDNEMARHKLLDVVGDLGLVGMPIKAKIIASKPGHACNIEFAQLLKKHINKQREIESIPTIDVDAPPILDTIAIKKLLPHRSPFLLVDKVIEMGKTTIVGVKNVTYNEPYFTGHFPQQPIMPGVLQIEAMAQTGGILAISRQNDKEGLQVFLVAVNHCKFRQPVEPGDVLVIKMELIDEMRRGFQKMKGVIYVGRKLVAEAELTAKIHKD